MPNMRKWSRILGLLACLAPTTWAYLELSAFNTYATEQTGGTGAICGLPVLAIIFLAGTAAAVLSLAAFTTSVFSLRGLVAPRPWSHLIETGAMLIPAIIGGGYVVLLLLL